MNLIREFSAYLDRLISGKWTVGIHNFYSISEHLSDIKIGIFSPNSTIALLIYSHTLPKDFELLTYVEAKSSNSLTHVLTNWQPLPSFLIDNGSFSPN